MMYSTDFPKGTSTLTYSPRDYLWHGRYYDNIWSAIRFFVSMRFARRGELCKSILVQSVTLCQITFDKFHCLFINKRS